ncbi:hypothetical protein FRC07_010035 [Ceratobasidium sp. 392]|nr:hypothetical protein FRC07_010035 [Ceratobasidium sp. 392]
MSSLVQLPEEFLVHVLCWANPIDIQSCRQVCSLLRKLVDSSAELQYLIELHSLGYVPPTHPRSNLTYPEAIELLHTHKSRWNSIHTIKSRRYLLQSVDSGYTSTYDFYGGVYARGSTPNSLSNATRRLELYQLPSVNRGTEFKQWTHHDVGVDTRDFAMEPDYDLLVLLELADQTSIRDAEQGTPNVTQYFNLNLRSLQTCAPHPDAAKPIIRHSLRSFARTTWSFYFQIVGRYLGVLFLIGLDQPGENQTCQLGVWDWTTGNPVTHVDIVAGDSKAFSFVSDHLIVIPRRATGTTQQEKLGTLELYTFDDPPAGSSQSPPARHIASLQLPAVPENMISTMLSCRSDPAPSPSTQAAMWNRRRPRLFELAPTNRVLCLRVQMTAVDQSQYLMHCDGTLFVPFANMLNAVAHLYGQSEPIDIVWEIWGHGTSWLDTGDFYMGNECYVFGQRTVSTTINAQDEDEEDSPRTRSLVVLDFDPVRLSKRSGLFYPGGGNLFTTRLDDDLLWDEFLGENVECKADARLSVQTALIRHKLPSTYYVMIDDEHIVLVLQNRFGIESALLVYSF